MEYLRTVHTFVYEYPIFTQDCNIATVGLSGGKTHSRVTNNNISEKSFPTRPAYKSRTTFIIHQHSGLPSFSPSLPLSSLLSPSFPSYLSCYQVSSDTFLPPHSTIVHLDIAHITDRVGWHSKKDSLVAIIFAPLALFLLSMGIGVLAKASTTWLKNHSLYSGALSRRRLALKTRPATIGLWPLQATTESVFACVPLVL